MKGLIFFLLDPKRTVAAESLWRPLPPVFTEHCKKKIKKLVGANCTQKHCSVTLAMILSALSTALTNAPVTSTSAVHRPFTPASELTGDRPVTALVIYWQVTGPALRDWRLCRRLPCSPVTALKTDTSPADRKSRRTQNIRTHAQGR